MTKEELIKLIDAKVDKITDIVMRNHMSEETYNAHVAHQLDLDDILTKLETLS